MFLCPRTALVYQWQPTGSHIQIFSRLRLGIIHIVICPLPGLYIYLIQPFAVLHLLQFLLSNICKISSTTHTHSIPGCSKNRPYEHSARDGSKPWATLLA